MNRPKMPCPRCGQIVGRMIDGSPEPHGFVEGDVQRECHEPISALAAALAKAKKETVR
jgi:hypothetical protein